MSEYFIAQLDDACARIQQRIDELVVEIDKLSVATLRGAGAHGLAAFSGAGRRHLIDRILEHIGLEAVLARRKPRLTEAASWIRALSRNLRSSSAIREWLRTFVTQPRSASAWSVAHDDSGLARPPWLPARYLRVEPWTYLPRRCRREQ